MRSSSILDIVRNAYFVTTTYSRHSKRVGVISSQRIEAENRIAALFEENVRRRGEESTTSSAENPTLEEIASFFKIPLDALIQCLNGLGPEVQLLMTALSLGTSYRSYIYMCVCVSLQHALSKRISLKRRYLKHR